MAAAPNPQGCEVIVKPKVPGRLADASATKNVTAKGDRIGGVRWDENGNAMADTTLRTRAIKIEPAAPTHETPPSSGFDPYQTAVPHRAQKALEKRPVKTDLRKLSEWIKKTRELEISKKHEKD